MTPDITQTPGQVPSQSLGQGRAQGLTSEVPRPVPVLATRAIETRGVWLDAANEPTEPGESGESGEVTAGLGRVWVPEHVLTALDDALTGQGWTRTEALSQDEALLAAGYAVRDGNSDFLRGTEPLHALLHPDLDQRGGHAYDPAMHGPWYFGDPGTEDMAEQASAEGFQRCVSCGTLPVRFSRLRYHDNRLTIEYENALVVTLAGGYAMFIDRMPVKVVFCHDCAHDLCDRYPDLGAELEPARAHAHTTRYRDEHPDHAGWDTADDVR